jgi:hypothetical protein
MPRICKTVLDGERLPRVLAEKSVENVQSSLAARMDNAPDNGLRGLCDNSCFRQGTASQLRKRSFLQEVGALAPT